MTYQIDQATKHVYRVEATHADCIAALKAAIAGSANEHHGFPGGSWDTVGVFDGGYWRGGDWIDGPQIGIAAVIDLDTWKSDDYRGPRDVTSLNDGTLKASGLPGCSTSKRITSVSECF